MYPLITFCISLIWVVVFPNWSDPVNLCPVFLLINWANGLSQSTGCVCHNRLGNWIDEYEKRYIQVYLAVLICTEASSWCQTQSLGIVHARLNQTGLEHRMTTQEWPEGWIQCSPDKVSQMPWAGLTQRMWSKPVTNLFLNNQVLLKMFI